MKKIIFLTLLFVSSIMFSQVTVQPGLRGGVNISEISGIKGERKTDFYLGVILSLNLGRFYTLQPEIAYSNQGGKNIHKQETFFDKTSNATGYKTTYKNYDLEYLSLGLTNKFFVTPTRDFHLLIAPSIDLVLDKNSGYNMGTGGYYVEDNTVSEVDLAMTLGMGYEFPFGLGVDARYKLGVVDVLGGIFSSLGTKNRVFQLGLTYNFFSKKGKKKNKKNNIEED